MVGKGIQMKRYRKIFWIFLILYFIYFLSFIPGYILLDVIPYKVLGNTPDESSKYPGEDAKAQNGNNFKENIDAQNHRAMELSRNVQSENTQNLG